MKYIQQFNLVCNRFYYILLFTYTSSYKWLSVNRFRDANKVFEKVTL